MLKERPDIVLMDINMPGELNGLDAAEAIVPVFHPCVVMITAYDDTEYRERAGRIPTDGYLIKPVTALTLIPQLEKACSP